MIVQGYVAVFDIVDQGGDIIRPGAFDESLSSKVPVFWEHDSSKQIGRVDYLAEDRFGLRARLILDQCQPEIKADHGLSFGYRVKSARPIPGGREIKSAEIVEVSLVRNPMQLKARLISGDNWRDTMNPIFLILKRPVTSIIMLCITLAMIGLTIRSCENASQKAAEATQARNAGKAGSESAKDAIDVLGRSEGRIEAIDTEVEKAHEQIEQASSVGAVHRAGLDGLRNVNRAGRKDAVQ